MDYVETLREERGKAHSIFHSLLLVLNKTAQSTVFLFFEGEDDPSFYLSHIRAHAFANEYSSHICFGRDEVFKVRELIERDERLVGRSWFFVDKDHSDIMSSSITPNDVFQTTVYSIENYVVCEQVFFAYWTEVLHLDSSDPRRDVYWEAFAATYPQFERRARTLMALVLLGRGVNAHPPRKLNLNNANLDLVFNINFESTSCRYRPGAAKQFVLSTNVSDCPTHVRRIDLKSILQIHVKHRTTKAILRGKYELWFFIKFLQWTMKILSDRALPRADGQRRATPKTSVSQKNAMELLATRCSCPDELRKYLSSR
jgi:Protein of unknown function (DUF4435)